MGAWKVPLDVRLRHEMDGPIIATYLDMTNVQLIRTLKTGTYLGLIFFVTTCVKTPITGKNAFIITSASQENQLGTDAYQQFLRKSTVSRNEDRTALLKRAANRIAKASEKMDYQWEFTLAESKEKNAFCLPGGKIAVFTGMMNEFANEAELASVLGHEVAHATARHAGQRITLYFGTEIGFAALSTLLGGGETTQKTLLLQALGLGATVGAILPFSRIHELEADYIGLIYLARAGYDPQATIAFWQRFGNHSASPPEFLSTHPNSEHRIREFQRHMDEAQIIYASSPKLGSGEPISPSQD